MAAGADCIDELDVIRAGGMGRLFGEVYACATVGQFLREFSGKQGRARAGIQDKVEWSGAIHSSGKQNEWLRASGQAKFYFRAAG